MGESTERAREGTGRKGKKTNERRKRGDEWKWGE